MRKPEPVLVKIADIKQTFFVRKQLNEDRVQFFANVLSSGGALPELKLVRDTNELADGRHRLAALIRLEKTDALCVYREPAPLPELIMDAMADNLGGALPPTEADLQFVIKQLLEGGMSRPKILDRLCEITPFPRKLVTRYLDNVQSEMARARLRQAVNAVVNDEKSVKVAAEEHNVDLDSLRSALKRDAAPSGDFNLHGTLKEVTGRFMSTSQKNANLLKGMIKDFEDGNLSRDNVNAVLTKITNNIKRMAQSHNDWVTRFDAMTKSSGSSTVSKKPTGSKKKAKGVVKTTKPTATSALERMGLK
jgi:ParB-like chromosome segregation protein Spo0J